MSSSLAASLLLLGMASVVSTSCGSSGSPALQPHTGVAGRVVAGPTCPVVGPACPPAKPVQTTVVIQPAPDGRDATAQQARTPIPTEADGRFAAALPPGRYVIEAQPPPSGHLLARSVSVQVHAAEISHVTVPLDTGIR